MKYTSYHSAECVVRLVQMSRMLTVLKCVSALTFMTKLYCAEDASSDNALMLTMIPIDEMRCDV